MFFKLFCYFLIFFVTIWCLREKRLFVKSGKVQRIAFQIDIMNLHYMENTVNSKKYKNAIGNHFWLFFDTFCRTTGMPDSKPQWKTVKFSLFVFGKGIAMRHEKEELLKEELRVLAIRTRDRLHLTQREMGKRLEMSENSYSDIETGKTMCGTLTAILLLNMQENPRTFFFHLEIQFAKQYEKEMQPI